MKSIELDYSKRCAEEPEKGHNRWHPDIPPALEVEPEEEVYLQTRDALDGQCKPDSTIEFFKTLDRNVVHPLTGPVYVKGAKPGDLLEIDIIDVVLGLSGSRPSFRDSGFWETCMQTRLFSSGRWTANMRCRSRFPTYGSLRRRSWVP